MVPLPYISLRAPPSTHPGSHFSLTILCSSETRGIELLLEEWRMRNGRRAVEVACYCTRSLKKPEARVRWRSGRQGACVCLSPSCRHSCQQQLPLNMALEYGAISRPSISCLKLGTCNQSPSLPQAAALHLLSFPPLQLGIKPSPPSPTASYITKPLLPSTHTYSVRASSLRRPSSVCLELPLFLRGKGEGWLLLVQLI